MKILRKRTIPIVIGVVVVVVALVAAVLLRRRAAPEPARLLPSANAYIYLDLKTLRWTGALGENTPIARDPDYLQFVAETGFQFERDLDEAAFAVHTAPSDKGIADRYPRYSEVFIGRFNTQRASAYFRKLAKDVEEYRDVEIYSIPLEGRTVRVALLGVETVAVSNTEGSQIIHGMIDRHKKVASPFGGPKLMRTYYHHVPFGSLAWLITAVTPDSQGSPTSMFVLPGGFDLFFPAATVLVGSVRYAGSVQLKAEAFAQDEKMAKQIADQANAFLTIFRGLETGATLGGTDPDVKAFFDSLTVTQENDRAVLTAAMPPGFLKKLFTEPPTGTVGAPIQPPVPEKEPPAPKKRRK